MDVSQRRLKSTIDAHHSCCRPAAIHRSQGGGLPLEATSWDVALVQRVLYLRHRVQALLARPEAVVNKGPRAAGPGELDLLDMDGITALEAAATELQLRYRRCLPAEALPLNLTKCCEPRDCDKGSRPWHTSAGCPALDDADYSTTVFHVFIRTYSMFQPLNRLYQRGPCSRPSQYRLLYGCITGSRRNEGYFVV